MGFLATVGTGLAKGLAGGIAGGLLGNVFGQSSGSKKREQRRSHQQTLEQVRLGNQLDLKNQKDMYDYRIMRGMNFGMTPYEMFMGPAGGAGGGTTGSGAVMGKASSDRGIAQKQIDKDRQLAWQTTVANNATALQQTKMQTEAQKDIAKGQVGVQERGQDVQRQIAEDTLNLNTRELEQIKIPQAAEQLGLTRQQVQTEINRTATSSERFQKELKQMSMGPANLLVELTMDHHGISLADDSFMKLSESKRKEILDELISMASTAYIEGKGTAALGKDTVESSPGDTIADWIASFVSTGEGIEATDSVPKLGKEEKFRPPRSYKRRGYAGPQPFKTN